MSEIPVNKGTEASPELINPETRFFQAEIGQKGESPDKYKHFYNLTPVCRVHVYQKNEGKKYGEKGKLPSHWCGPNPDPNKLTKAPDFIIGKDGMYLPGGEPMEWQILTARVNTTRQWQCSSAMFQMAAPMDASTPAKASPIRPTDVIVIEMGYCNGMDSNVALSPNLTADGRIPPDAGRTNYNTFAGDVVFYGIVDTVKERGGSGEKDGVIVTVMARDPMSILVDNKMRGHYNPANLVDYNRAYIVRDLIWRGAAMEYVQWQDQPDKDGFRQPKKAPNDNKQVLPEKFTDANCYLNIGVLEKSQRSSLKLPDTGGQSTGTQLTDRFPLDIIRHFSLVETAPRELWADRRTGEVHWQFRRTDMRRLRNQPETRQYFYRFPANRANIVSYTMEWSTAGTITHFTITNPISAAQGMPAISEMYAESPTAKLIDPHRTAAGGQNLMRPLTKNLFIYDDTLMSDAETPIVAGALLNIWGRTIETGMIMLPGDPSLEIGEAVQVFNTGLFGKRWHESDSEGNNRTGTTANGYESENPEVAKDPRFAISTPYEQGYPEGIFRVEALTHLFAVGGAHMGYRTVMVVGPVDENTGDPKRLITSTEDLTLVKKININDAADNGNVEPTTTPES